MAQPITWNNVGGTDLTNVSNIMGAAQRSIGGAFTGLQDIIKERQAVDASNVVQTTKNNSQDYLNKVAAIGATPEKLQQFIASGDKDKLLASYGDAIDHDVVRGAAENLLDQRYKQVQQATNFGNAMLNEKTAPILSGIQAALRNKDVKLADQLKAQYAAVGGKDPDAIASFAEKLNRDNMTFDETTKQWGRNDAKHLADLQHMRNQDANASAQTAIARRNATVNEGNLKLQSEEMGFKRADRADDRISKIAASIGSIGNDSASSTTGQQTINDVILKTYKDLGSRDTAQEAMAMILKKNPKATVGAVLAGITGMGESNAWNPFDLDYNRRATAVDIADKIMASPETKAAGERSSLREAALYEQLDRARKASSSLTPNGNKEVSVSATGDNNSVPAEDVSFDEPPEVVARRAAAAMVPPASGPVKGAGGNLAQKLDAAAAAANPKRVAEIETMNSAQLRALSDKFKKEMQDIRNGKKEALSADAAAFRAYTNPPDSLGNPAVRNKLLSDTSSSVMKWLLEP